MKKKNITINSRKFDGSIHRSWKADLIKQIDTLYVFVGKFKKEVKHSELGVIRRNTISYEYYWLDRWYNIFRFHEPNGELRNFYCNINIPPKLINNVLDYIDLDLDILIDRNFDYKVLDKDEYAENSIKYNYSDKIKRKVTENVQELEKMIKLREFPFTENETLETSSPEQLNL